MKPCKIWTKGTSNNRPMTRSPEGKLVQADRLAYEQQYGVKLTKKDRFDKTCGEKMCIEPEHMKRMEVSNPEKARKMQEARARRKRVFGETIGQAAARRVKQLKQQEKKKQQQLIKEERARQKRGRVNAESTALKRALKNVQP